MEGINPPILARRGVKEGSADVARKLFGSATRHCGGVAEGTRCGGDVASGWRGVQRGDPENVILILQVDWAGRTYVSGIIGDCWASCRVGNLVESTRYVADVRSRWLSTLKALTMLIWLLQVDWEDVRIGDRWGP